MTGATPQRCPALKDGFAWYEKLLARGGLAGMMVIGVVGIGVQSTAAAAGYLVFAAVGSVLVIYDLLCVYCPYPYQHSDCLFFPHPLLWSVVGQRTGAIPWFRRGLFLAVTGGLVVIPQFWLWANWPLFAAFWLVTVPLGRSFPLFFCRRCRHRRCPINRVEF